MRERETTAGLWLRGLKESCATILDRSKVVGSCWYHTAHAEVAYKRNLKGLKSLALVMDVTTVCSWSLGFCALTWASAVLLGAYVTELSIWQYYDVSVLLFVEGLRFGVALVVRIVGIYRLPPLMRWLLRSAAVFVPLWMGGFALFILLPPHISQNFRNHFAQHRNLSAPFHFANRSAYNSLIPSLTIFYSLILINAVVLLVGRFISGLIHLLYVQHNDYRSIHKYHDKMQLIGSSSWIQAGFDFDYAFRMQSSEYERGGSATKVCEIYMDLIDYLYRHKRGVEATEVALGAEDVYVREAAANIVGFFAVLEELHLEKLHEVFQQELLEKCNINTPLCYQMGILSKLADLASGGYGPASTVAAYSFALLLVANKEKPENIRMVGRVRNGQGKDLLYILLQRFLEILDAPSNTFQGALLEQNSKGHLYALRQLLLLCSTRRSLVDQRPQPQTEAQDASSATVVQVKQTAQKMKQLSKEIFGLDEEADEEDESLDQDDLSRLLSSSQIKKVESDNYYTNIKNALRSDSHDKDIWKHFCRGGIFILVNVALPLILGFSVKAFLHH